MRWFTVPAIRDYHYDYSDHLIKDVLWLFLFRWEHNSIYLSHRRTSDHDDIFVAPRTERPDSPSDVAQPSRRTRQTESGRTTVMLRNIPNNYTRPDLRH